MILELAFSTREIVTPSGRKLMFLQIDGGERSLEDCVCLSNSPEHCPIDLHRIRWTQQVIAGELPIKPQREKVVCFQKAGAA